MSNRKNQSVSDWKVVEEYLFRRNPLLYDTDTCLGYDASSLMHQSYMLWYLLTEDTLCSFGLSPFFSKCFIWLDAVQSTPVRKLIDSLKSFSSIIINGREDDFLSFKQKEAEKSVSIDAILAPVEELINRWYHENDPSALNLLFTWASFLTHLNLPDLSVLEDEALEKYLLIEQNILTDGLSDEESSVLETWFPRTLEDRCFLSDHHKCSHGPGSTADGGKSPIGKYLSLKTDDRLTMLVNQLSCYPYPRIIPKGLDRCSKTIFVPKTAASYRTISMEPASLMWHQKGVRDALLGLLKARRHYLLRRYTPTDQQPNKDLAWEGSIDGSFATIDLSSASDSVSWLMVRKWFGNTSLYPWLLWTRSIESKLPNGQRISLKKFAPMGSDLCFPIETILFCAIAECSIRECGEDPVTSRYRVYGDDIVIESRFAQKLSERLLRNGFLLNKEKTYAGSQPYGFFRESCGGFYFNGDDISPLRLSRKFSGYSPLDVTTPQRISSLIMFANECSTHYPSVRRWCVNSLLSLPRHLRPIFSSDGSTGLFSTQPSNFHLIKRMSETLQCDVYTFGTQRSTNEVSKEEWEDIRLFEYLRRTDGRRHLTWPEDRVDADVAPLSRSHWVTRRSPLY